MSRATSMELQLEASGVRYQGLRKWKRTEPMTSIISTIANTIFIYNLFPPSSQVLKLIKLLAFLKGVIISKKSGLSHDFYQRINPGISWAVLIRQFCVLIFNFLCCWLNLLDVDRNMMWSWQIDLYKNSVGWFACMAYHRVCWNALVESAPLGELPGKSLAAVRKNRCWYSARRDIQDRLLGTSSAVITNPATDISIR